MKYEISKVKYGTKEMYNSLGKGWEPFQVVTRDMVEYVWLRRKLGD